MEKVCKKIASLSLILVRYLFFLLIFKNISGFAIKHLTDCRKGGKADSRDLVIFDLGEIDVGDSYALGKLVQRDLLLHHHSIKSKYDLSHISPLKEVRQRRFQALHREQRTERSKEQ